MNKKLNVGVIIDITPESGGKLHVAISMCKYLKQIKEYNFFFKFYFCLLYTSDAADE